MYRQNLTLSKLYNIRGANIQRELKLVDRSLTSLVYATTID